MSDQNAIHCWRCKVEQLVWEHVPKYLQSGNSFQGVHPREICVYVLPEDMYLNILL